MNFVTVLKAVVLRFPSYAQSYFSLTDEMIPPVFFSRFTYFLLRNLTCRYCYVSWGETARFLTYKLHYITYRGQERKTITNKS